VSSCRATNAKCGTQVANHSDRATLCQLFAEVRRQALDEVIALAKEHADVTFSEDREHPESIVWDDVDAALKRLKEGA
jgi:hypothetical protein